MPDAVVSLSFLRHAIVVPVRIDDALDARFVLDTGIGINVVSTALAERLGLAARDAEFRGRRMSGQEIAVPRSRLRSLSVGTARREDVSVGLFDLDGFPPEFEAVDGFVSLAFFETQPFTIDGPRRALVIETPETLAARERDADEVALSLRRENGALDAFLPLDLGVGEPAWVEIDTGSDCLILDMRYASRLGVDLDGPRVRRSDGVDETGNPFVRRFARLSGGIAPVGAPTRSQAAPAVMFQRIIYDGLLGQEYLRSVAATFDLPRSRLLLSGGAGGAGPAAARSASGV